MDFLSLAKRRRTVHKYQKSEVSAEFIQDALLAALMAPNHKHTFPWFFVVVGKQTRLKLAHRVFEIKKLKNPELAQEDKQKAEDSFLDPGALVVFAQKKSESECQSKEDYASMACAIQNFSLSLAEKNIGTKWSTAAFISDPQMYTILDLDPSHVEIIGFVWAGLALGEVSEQRRPYLSDVTKVLP